MNKLNLLKLALVVVLSTAASTAYADTEISAATLLGGNSFSPSNNVLVHVATDGNSDAFDGNQYSAKTKHTKGDKIIGCLSGDSKLYFTTVSNVTETEGLAAATTDDLSSWTSM